MVVFLVEIPQIQKINVYPIRVYSCVFIDPVGQAEEIPDKAKLATEMAKDYYESDNAQNFYKEVRFVPQQFERSAQLQKLCPSKLSVPSIVCFDI